MGDYSNIDYGPINNEYLKSKDKLIFTTTANKILKLTNLPGYTFINLSQFYEKTKFCYHCYTKDDQTFYRIGNDLFKINVDISSGNIYKKINQIDYKYVNNRFLLIELLEKGKNSFYMLLQKLNLCLKNLSYSVWLNKSITSNNYVVEIVHNNKIINFVKFNIDLTD